jgi:drug/metabolite transporter (DMT)-like permease
LAVVSLATAVFLGLLVIAEGGTLVIRDLRSIAALGAYGVFSQAIGWMLISKGLPGVRVSLAGLLILIQPSLAYVWDILIFSLSVTPMKIAGTLITLWAIYLGSSSQKE